MYNGGWYTSERTAIRRIILFSDMDGRKYAEKSSGCVMIIYIKPTQVPFVRVKYNGMCTYSEVILVGIRVMLTRLETQNKRTRRRSVVYKRLSK